MADDKDDDKKSGPRLVDPRGPGTGYLKIGGDHERPGRPPNEFRAKLREITTSPEVMDALLKILKNPKHPQYSSLWKAVAAQGHGSPLQQIELNAESLPTLKVERE